MKLETVFRAALHDMQSGKEKPHCGNPPYHMEDDEPLGNINWAEDYAEPGYDTPKAGILTGNWNQYPSRLTDILERMGYAIEWEDEWSTCENCNKLVRTSADSYSWRRSYVIYNDCELICANCVQDDLDEYEAHLLNDASVADTFDIDWAARGFVKFNEKHYENGWHPGQNDNPRTIAKNLPANHDFLFSIPTVGQFDVAFDCWIRPREL